LSSRVFAFHNLIIPYGLPVARVNPSGEKAMTSDPSLSSNSAVTKHYFVLIFHNLRVLSPEAVTMELSSGENWAEKTHLLCPLSTASHLKDYASHIFNVVSLDPDAIFVPALL